MAQLALGVAGAAVGSLFGMPALGFSIGSALGGYAVSSGQTVKGPRLSDLKVQTSSQGTPIPKIWGRYRTAGNVDWSTGLIETEVTESAGKGGGPKVKNYSYKSSFKVVICEGTIAGIRKIWADGKLIYDVSADADIETQASTSTIENYITVYKGTADQEPDPTMEAIVGEGNVPAFRGEAYIVFDDFPLDDFGQRLPMFHFEVIESGVSGNSGSIEFLNPLIFAPWASSQGGLPDPAVWTWDTYFDFNYDNNGWTTWQAAIDQAAGDGHDPEYLDLSSPIGTATDSALDFNTLYGSGLQTGEDSLSFYFILNYSFDSAKDPAGGGANFVNCDDVGSEAGPNGEMVYGSFSGVGKGVYWGAGHPSAPPPTPFNQQVVNNCTTGGGENEENWYTIVGNTNAVIHVRRKKGPPLNICVTEPLPENPTSFCIDHKTGFISRRWFFGSSVEDENGYLQLQLEDTGAVGYTQYPQWLRTDNIQADQSVLRTGDNKDTEEYWQGVLLEAGSAGVPLAVSPGDYTSDRPNSDVSKFPVSVDQIAVTNHEYAYSVTPALASLSDIVSEVCEEAGLESSDIDVTDISGINVLGYARPRPMRARDALEGLGIAFFFDAVETEGKVKFVRRGKEPVMTIPRESLGAYAENETPPAELEIVRRQETELPKEVRFYYSDANSDYEDGMQYSSYSTTGSDEIVTVEIPVVLIPSQGGIIADKMLFEERIGRGAAKFTLPRDFLALDPVDTVVVQCEDASYRLRITSIEFDGYLRLEGVTQDAPLYSNLDDDYSDEAYIYTSTHVGAGPDNNASLGLNMVGPTILNLLDLPATDESSDNPGFFWIGYGPLSGWKGASLERSLDEGTNWTELDTAFDNPTYGVLEGVLGDGNVYVRDLENTFDVELTNGSLQSITENALLSYGNLAAIGVAGRWEFVQFKDVTDLGDGVYRCSHLLRGRFGTEQYASQHADGDSFVLMNSSVERYPGEISRIGNPGLYRTVSFNGVAQGVTETEFTPQAVALKPLSPVHGKTYLQDDDSVNVTWVRRDRIDYGWRDGVGTSNSEDSEEYEGDVYEGETLLRTMEIEDTTELNYSVANYNTDTGGAASTLPALTFIIYQISATLGRGYPLEIEYGNS